jgi:hypothetical protein
MPILRMREKENGARNVLAYDVHIDRRYHVPEYYRTTHTVEISVEFSDDEAATEFENMVLDLLPEMAL